MRTWVIGDTGIAAEIAHQLIYLADFEERTGDSIWISGKDDVDVRNNEQVRSWISKHGPFDEVVYCAGVASLAWIGELDLRDVADNVFGANIIGFINVLNILQQQRQDSKLVRSPISVVALGSDAARVPMRTSIAYCASKAALVQAVKVAARELAPVWRVNCVSPAIVQGTPMTEYIDANVGRVRGWSDEQTAAYELSNIPMGRRATKVEVAKVVIDVLRGPQFLSGANVEITGAK